MNITMVTPQAFHLLVQALEYQIVEIADPDPGLVADPDPEPGIHLDQM
jgi:hypothetical protein